MAINFPSAPTLNQISQVGLNFYIWDGASWVGYSTSFSLSETVTYATSAGIATYATLAGIATYANSAGIATYANSAGIATYSTSAGIATYSISAGIATYTTSSGIATYAPNSGIATYSISAGIATYTTSSGIATYATSAGIATYATLAGIATYANSAGIATYASEWILGANGSSDYTFTGPGLIGAENDPVLYLVRGQQYKFTNTMGQHPFRIQSTVNGSAGTEYNDGITNNNVSNGSLTWNVQFDTPSLLYYNCTVGGHGSMGGKIYIIDAGIGPDISINTTGIITASSFGGNASSATYASNAGIATYATNAGIATYATSSGISTNAQGLTGTPNLNVGIVTATSFVGNGANLTGIGVTTIVNGNSNITVNSNNTITTTANSATINTVSSTGIAMSSGKRFDLSSFTETVNTLGSAGSPISGSNTLDVGTYSTFIAYVGTSSVTFSLTGVTAGKLVSWTIILIYTNSGSRTINFSFGTLRYPGGASSVTLSNTAVHDVLSFFTADNASNTYASIIGLGFVT